MLEQREDVETIVESFKALNIKPDLLKGIKGYGFAMPSVVQSKCILPLIKGRDLIVQAQSGTGKTAAFAIAILQLIDPDSQKCQALVVVPTRELAQGIQRMIMCLGEHLKVSGHVCSGGTNIRDERKKLQGGVQFVIGTPGRVLDMIKRGFLKTDHLKFLVLDEADEMIGRGFQDQLKEILKSISGDAQISFFSINLPPEVLALTSDFMRDPSNVVVRTEELTLDGVKQFCIAIDKKEWKFDTLIELFNNIDIMQCIVYCNKKAKVDELTNNLNEKGFAVSSMHGDMDQNQRELVIREFRTGVSRVLITTDLPIRGIDIQQVSLVINYDIPLSKEKYIHRIGRVGGRFRRSCVSINFVTPTDYKSLQELEKFYNTEFVEMPLDVTNILD